MDCLSEDDRRLPQIQHLPGMLRRGVGVHHSGLLPIVKEVIEILFQEGLIKVRYHTRCHLMVIALQSQALAVLMLSILVKGRVLAATRQVNHLNLA